MRDHGYARYRLDGCRCYTCSWARAQYDDRRNMLILSGNWQPFVPIEETQHRIADLKALGLGDRSIARLAGLQRKTIRDITDGIRHDGTRGNRPLTKIRAETAAAIAAIAFDPLLAPGETRIDATLTWDRIHALIRAGYTRTWIARELGSTSKTPALQLDEQRISANNARAVRDLVLRVGIKPGPSARARREGEANDWPLIDDFLPARNVSTAPRNRHVVSAAEILARVEAAGEHLEEESA
ncbi:MULTISPECIES: hypothetical protein [unclassified Nocardioides]|uniref:hypothetical protein n=1 Tax=unclassified Nocardioides TaxID=2615069 RepID=UPI0009F015B4|nr:MULTISPECIES: hypothetical protein [unclassified Nocardioides]GAW50594.1 uncharacterized protein PD653B2_2930 [Nocardioides sp. PD653-B2]GAW57619.1 uncharacterized protein PD653_5065 [Nocardioides sp. PD653]